MKEDFEMNGDFDIFVNELESSEKNANAVCGLDSSECDSCGS